MWPFSFKKEAKLERKGISKEYVEFLLQEQRLREPKSWYEKLCKFSESIHAMVKLQ
jgi:hypothetical protein